MRNVLQKIGGPAHPSFLFCDANFQKVGAQITFTDTPIVPKSFMLIIVLGCVIEKYNKGYVKF